MDLIIHRILIEQPIYHLTIFIGIMINLSSYTYYYVVLRYITLGPRLKSLLYEAQKLPNVIALLNVLMIFLKFLLGIEFSIVNSFILEGYSGLTQDIFRIYFFFVVTVRKLCIVVVRNKNVLHHQIHISTLNPQRYFLLLNFPLYLNLL